jgi:lipopolysaccharide export LptBFGC system permease protein LptF
MTFHNISKTAKITFIMLFVSAFLIILNSVIKYLQSGDVDPVFMATLATIPMALILFGAVRFGIKQ